MNHRHDQFPVRKDDSGAVLVSGASPIVFRMVISGEISPEAFMLSVVNGERYAPVGA